TKRGGARPRGRPSTAGGRGTVKSTLQHKVSVLAWSHAQRTLPAALPGRPRLVARLAVLLHAEHAGAGASLEGRLPALARRAGGGGAFHPAIPARGKLRGPRPAAPGARVRHPARRRAFPRGRC